MPETHAPVTVADVPSSRTLLRSTMIAAGVAVHLLITVVLPAEYGVDPTGVGRVLGLTEMGEIKVALAKEAAAADSVEAAARASGAGDSVQSGTPAPALAAPTAAAAAVEALAQVQAACLIAGGCADPLPVPEDLN